jgi:hypothetical protein
MEREEREEWKEGVEHGGCIWGKRNNNNSIILMEKERMRE